MLNFNYPILLQLLFFILTFSLPVALCKHEAIESLLHRLDSKRALPSVQEAAARGVLRRLLPTHLSSFEFKIVSKDVCGGESCFIINNHKKTRHNGPEIIIRGTTGVEIVSGLHWYLKYWCGAHISWDKTGGIQTTSIPKPGSLPLLKDDGVKIKRPVPWNYYQNVVTSSYSFVWWDWERWEKEVDWMALQGVNLPLAFTGQEAIWQKVFKDFNISSEDLNSFFGGPAFLAWARMGNLHGWGGPLSQNWLDQQLILQKRILSRMLELGKWFMNLVYEFPCLASIFTEGNVLPSFSGNVPAALRKIFPSAKITRLGDWNTVDADSRWCCTYLLDPSDPRFVEIGEAFIRKQIKEYGDVTDIYNCDTFNENSPPTSDPDYISTLGAAVYQGISKGDKDAVWLMQGWLFYSDSSFWKPPQMKALLQSVPVGKMIVLDLFAEVYDVLNNNHAFSILLCSRCMLHNFGGNLEMYGVLDAIGSGPVDARVSANSTMVGVGMCMEGIEHNPIVFELMSEMAFRDEKVKINEWLKSYSHRRYGKAIHQVDAAWEILYHTIYNCADGIAMAATMIGGAFLNATVKILLDKLSSTEFLDYIRNTKLDDSLLRKLQSTLLTLQAVLDDAEERQINNLAVKKWLDDLKDIVLDAEDLVNEISYDSLRCKMENRQAGSRTNQVLNFLSSPFKNFYRDINSQLKIMCETLEPFAQHKDTLGLQTKSARVSRRPPSSSGVNESVMVGRNDDKDKIINMLVSDCGISKNNNLGVVAILGMGGLGKTALAQLVYNNEKVEQHFDFKVWVCVSEDFDVLRVTKSLLESVVRSTTSAASKVWESDNLDILRVELNKNTRNKRFLFVLDDLWNDNYNDWDELVSPLIDGKPGSSVIITTRQQKVAEMAKTFPIYKLDPLSHEDCWSILSKHALGSDEYHANKNIALEEIGRKIARKCAGLPLAAKTMGGLLRSRVDTMAWTDILNSNVWNLPNDNILPALHLSYQYLPSHLKRCFAYCSIFPKDYPLDRKKLVLLWMAEGFLDYSHGGKLVEDVGDDCFAELLSRSLIQQSNDGARGKSFFMHDLINDLATAVSGKICCRSECGDISEKVRHLSYIQDEYDIFTKFRPFYNFKCLRSFLPITFQRSYNYLSFKVVDDLVPLFKRLRMLSLSNYANITNLPDSIGNLVQLRYLDLSFTEIKSLPDTICNLYNLQTLILLDCYSLAELPGHMGNLISLRHLDISGTRIKELPMEIGGLENLQTLSVFLVGKRHEGLSIKELRKFPNLQGKFTIENLYNVVDAKEAEEANLKSKEKIEKLELLWGEISEDSLKVKVVLEMLQPPINLKSLKIDLYGGTSFPNWLGNSSFSNMVSLEIHNCKYCMTLPPLGQLPSLKKLSISNLLLLETIGPEFYCVEEGECSNPTFQPFPSLEHMKFHNMPNWKDWIPFEGVNFAFPQLRIMALRNCPELRGNLPSHLSCMEEIEIGGCYKLLETSHTLHWLSTIKKVNIEEAYAQRTPRFHATASSIYPMFISKTITSSICLTHLTLRNIPSLTAFPTSGLPTSLQSLRINGCRKLSFMPFETFQNYTSLVSLYLLDSCDSLTSFPLDGFPMLQTLSIYYCRSMNSIFISESPSRRQSSLRSLSINSIESFNVNLQLDTLTNLERLSLSCSGELSFREGVCLPPKLQSIWISFRGTKPHVKEWGLQDLTSLSTLRIRGEMDNTLRMDLLLPTSLVSLGVDGNMSFEGNGFRHLSSLQNLDLNNCQHLKSLPENCLPSSLKSLQFSNCQHLKSLPENCLPSSLKSLEFYNCQQLESLPENCLPSSMKSLQFSKCEQLESLPEDSLPASLMRLTIRECPLLEERYKRKENWSKIAHIPVIKINDQVTI